MEGNRSQQILRQADSPARIMIDAANLGFAGFLLLLAVLLHQHVLKLADTIVSCVIAGGLYAGMVVWFKSVRRTTAAVLVYGAAVLLMTSFFFEIAGNLQHVVVTSWQDTRLLGLEDALFGAPASVRLEPYVSRWLTEAMMFAYVAYVPLVPLTLILTLRGGGLQAAEEYLLNLSLANIVCYLGFMVLPAAGPIFDIKYTVPLEGGFFTQCAEWIRAHAHYAGGSLPSPHCAAATVVAVMLFRYRRKIFYAVLPVVLLLYMATVYGRFHYLADSVSGIVSALVVVRVSPFAGRAVEAARGVRIGGWFRRRPVIAPEVIPLDLSGQDEEGPANTI